MALVCRQCNTEEKMVAYLSSFDRSVVWVLLSNMPHKEIRGRDLQIEERFNSGPNKLCTQYYLPFRKKGRLPICFYHIFNILFLFLFIFLNKRNVSLSHAAHTRQAASVWIKCLFRQFSTPESEEARPRS